MDVVVDGHKVVPWVATSRNPRSFSVGKSCRKQPRVDGLAIDGLLFDTPDLESVRCIHKLLQRLMHEQNVAACPLVREVVLLVHEPRDGITADTVGSWEPELIRALEVLRIEGVETHYFLFACLVHDWHTTGEVTELLLGVASGVAVGVPLVSGPRVLEI